MARNVFLGASFASPYEVQQATEHGLSSQVLWGSDYPHLEGTFVYDEDREVSSVHSSPRSVTPSALPLQQIFAAWLGRTRIGLYNLDHAALSGVASQIAAPNLEELTTPIERVPDGASVTAFRVGEGSWS